LFRADQGQPMVAMNRVSETQANAGNGNANAIARERFLKAMQDVRFDESKWRMQFASDEPLLTKVVLAGERTNPPAAPVQGIEQLRQLVLDPAYQLK